MGRLKRAVFAAAGSIATTALGVLAAVDGLGAVAAMLAITAAGLMLYARHWARLAGRSRVGARSEEHVQRALALALRDRRSDGATGRRRAPRVQRRAQLLRSRHLRLNPRAACGVELVGKMFGVVADALV